MSLLDSMKAVMPETPDPPDKNMEAISNALDIAITIHIRTSLSPGIGGTFVANVPFQNQFISNLGSWLDTTVSPIISAAASVQSTLGGPLPAWASVQPSFDVLMLSVPPFMSGIFGALFWNAILITIRTALPPPPSEQSENSNNSQNGGREEVLRIDR